MRGTCVKIEKIFGIVSKINEDCVNIMTKFEKFWRENPQKFFFNYAKKFSLILRKNRGNVKNILRKLRKYLENFFLIPEENLGKF